MKFTPKFRAPVLDVDAYRRLLNQQMEEWLKQAARDWLRATVVAVIPVWSKASRATFQKLANEAGMVLSSGRQLSRKDRESLGRSASEGSGLLPNPRQSRWHFRYQTNLRYLIYNEYNRVVYGQAPNVFSKSGLNSPTPYHFQQKGQQAFEEFSRHTRLPNPYKFLKTGKVV